MSRPFANENAFRAIADPTRRRLIELLRKGDKSPADLAGAIGVTRPTMAYHLGILRTAGVVSQRREGRRLLYALNEASLRPVAAWLRTTS
jgi:DNA-binding transcriptional ArsR family regulator